MVHPASDNAIVTDGSDDRVAVQMKNGEEGFKTKGATLVDQYDNILALSETNKIVYNEKVTNMHRKIKFVDSLALRLGGKLQNLVSNRFIPSMVTTDVGEEKYKYFCVKDIPRRIRELNNECQKRIRSVYNGTSSVLLFHQLPTLRS